MTRFILSGLEPLTLRVSRSVGYAICYRESVSTGWEADMRSCWELMNPGNVAVKQEETRRKAMERKHHGQSTVPKQAEAGWDTLKEER